MYVINSGPAASGSFIESGPADIGPIINSGPAYSYIKKSGPADSEIVGLL